MSGYDRKRICSAEITTIDTIALSDLFCTGHITTEVIGPNTRVTFYTQKTTEAGAFHVPVAPIIIPTDSINHIAQRLAAAYVMARSDFIGRPRGSG